MRLGCREAGRRGEDLDEDLDQQVGADPGNDADAAVQAAMLSGEAADATPTTGIDTDCVDSKAIGRLFATEAMRADLDECEERFYEALMPRQNQQN